MLTHPTLDQLHALGLHGMAKGFKELEVNPEARALEHPEWLALLLEHETTLRRQKRFEARARAARLRQSASIEDVDYRAARGLDRTLFRKLASCEWIRARRNLIITGPCESGSYCPPRYAVRMSSHFDVDRQTTAAEYGVDPQRA
jgi:DNA replication protein DnaC